MFRNKEQKYSYKISPPVVFCKKAKICSQNFRKIHRKTAVMKSDKVAGPQVHVKNTFCRTSARSFFCIQTRLDINSFQSLDPISMKRDWVLFFFLESCCKKCTRTLEAQRSHVFTLNYFVEGWSWGLGTYFLTSERGIRQEGSSKFQQFQLEMQEQLPRGVL